MFQLTIPMDDIPPPFRDEEANRHFDFLQNTTMTYRDTKQRIPSADRTAVMELAASVDKHRLRRQQQLLLDMAERWVTPFFTGNNFHSKSPQPASTVVCRLTRLVELSYRLLARKAVHNHILFHLSTGAKNKKLQTCRVISAIGVH